MNHHLFHLAAHIWLHLAWIFASSCFGEWTGIRVLMDNPQAAWVGQSSCPPCNIWCDDLIDHIEGTSWRVGFTEYRQDGTANHIVLQRPLPDNPGSELGQPRFEFVRDGRVIGGFSGYSGVDGEVRFILRKYPGGLVTKARPQQFQQAPPQAIHGYEGASSYRWVQTYPTMPERLTMPMRQYYLPPVYQQQQLAPAYRGVCVNGVCY